ncbi:MAG: Hpt domain-containing protein [Chromatiaceae bacterium]|nr:Hpt domain-containing protein [Chromatiaceae bacterium]MBP6808458.1 Hpt domain-containing protein [Chromatiaceae bacterium]MBP8197277.1 Hpt domain-containing protein [Chromatiaceae bacterium]MBP8283677.1 Hpt domain-containing protein [Chromatiaceae bacterium]
MTSHNAAGSQGLNPGDLIDRSVLARVLDDVGLENADMLLDVFIEELAGQAQALEAAAGVDLEAMGRAAHQIKGSAATLGAIRLGHLAESIEAAARARDAAAAGVAMADFNGLVQASRQALGQIRQEGFGATN